MTPIRFAAPTRPDGERAPVTGGAGFLGSHLCARALERGTAVDCADTLSTDSADNVAPLLDRPGFRLLEHDMARPRAPYILDGRHLVMCRPMTDVSDRRPRRTMGGMLASTEMPPVGRAGPSSPTTTGS